MQLFVHLFCGTWEILRRPKGVSE
ncbi:Protein of unknown function [Gryllus bimaculatus]|nr:Protein of unknown function [Gryllus bimaculatus]